MLSSGDAWTIRHSFEGTLIAGSTGSGKSNGSGPFFALPLLLAQYGGLILCFKNQEVDVWLRRARLAKREQDVVLFSPSQPYRFNYLQYEMTREGAGAGEVENLVQLIMEIVGMVDGGKVEMSGDSAFWNRAMKELTRAAIALLKAAGGDLSLETISNMVADAPQTTHEAQQMRADIEAAPSAESLPGTLANLIWQAVHRELDHGQRHDLEVSLGYWLKLFPALSDRTRTGIVATYTGVASVLSHGAAYQLMGTALNITPEAIYKQGKIVIVALPIAEWHDAGRVVAGIWKYMYQRAIIRRKVQCWPRPCFLWIDEAQEFIGPNSYDPYYQSVAREARSATVLLMQSVSALYSALGRDKAHALLSNLSTKIFHAQMDSETNEYASRLIASHLTQSHSFSVTQGGHSASSSEVLRARIMAGDFTFLAKGGPPHWLVEGIVFQGGKRFAATGETFMKCVFRQRFD